MKFNNYSSELSELLSVPKQHKEICSFLLFVLRNFIAKTDEVFSRNK